VINKESDYSHIEQTYDEGSEDYSVYHTRITAMQRDTYLQEWLQTDIERVIIAAGFKLITSRPFEREGGEYPLLSILAYL